MVNEEIRIGRLAPGQTDGGGQTDRIHQCPPLNNAIGEVVLRGPIQNYAIIAYRGEIIAKVKLAGG